ncbi:Helix-loop-helix DNA-binding domain protein [Trichuris suis]|nr:Helix-loop-helix DNA-binding domain protein [Trichuris suis]
MKADRLRTVRLDDADVIRNGDELDKVDFKSNKAVVLCDMNGKSASTAIEKAAATDDRSRDTDVTSLRVDQEKRLRREIANSNERRRMQSINAGFQMLRSLLPKKGEKMSKLSEVSCCAFKRVK